MRNDSAVRHHIKHDPKTGQIWEKVGRRGCPAGTELGTPILPRNHVQLTFYKHRYYRAHIIVFLETGKWPRQVTRRNGLGHDDRLENIRIHW